MVELVTPRLRLRRARLADAPAMHAVLSSPVAMRYWSSIPHKDLEETTAWVQGMIDEGQEDFVIEHQGVAIGKAGCYRLPEVGYILRPDLWGQGLATEALGAVIGYVFTATPTPTLTADVDPRNVASLALLAKLGFRETGRKSRTWNVGGEWCDSVYLALDRASFSPRP